MPARVQLLAGLVARAALVDVPAVVVQRRAAARGVRVDLLPRVLADVADVEVARRRGRTRSATGCAARSRRSASARPRLFDVQAQQLAEARRSGSARGCCGSPPEPPSPMPDVEAAVRAELRAGRRCGSRTAGRTNSSCRAPSSAAPRCRSSGTRRRACCRCGRCSRRRSGGSSRSSGGTRPRAAPARRRCGRGGGCRGTAARAACRSRARGSRPAARRRRACPARCAARST